MAHRITAARIANFKMVREVVITPTADRSIILIAGRNAQGKSSVLDALTAAFGGKRAVPSDPVRHGEERSEILVELDGGKLVVRRTITPDGGGTLEVRGADGPMRSPQAVLDQLIGGDRFLDPIAFLLRTPPEQRSALLKIADPDGKIHKLEARRQEVFDGRTETGRELKRFEADLASSSYPIAAPGDVPPIEDVIDVAALSNERAAHSEQQHVNAKAAAERDLYAKEIEATRRNLGDIGREISALEEQLKAKKKAHALLIEDMKAKEEKQRLRDDNVAKLAAEWNAGTQRRFEIDAALARANEHNQRVYNANAMRSRRTVAETNIAAAKARHIEQTAKIEQLERRKTEVIAAAKLPIDGLGVAPDGVTLNGVPFAQASGAERLRVALALAIAASPNLADIWIRDGALLDDESLAVVEEHAAATGHTVWIERVGTGDVGAIVIEDGRVVS